MYTYLPRYLQFPRRLTGILPMIKTNPNLPHLPHRPWYERLVMYVHIRSKCIEYSNGSTQKPSTRGKLDRGSIYSFLHPFICSWNHNTPQRKITFMNNSSINQFVGSSIHSHIHFHTTRHQRTATQLIPYNLMLLNTTHKPQPTQTQTINLFPFPIISFNSSV